MALPGRFRTAMVRGALTISNPGDLNAWGRIFRRQELHVRRWPRHLEDDKRSPMTEFLAYALIPIAIGAVAVVLVLGLANMARGGSPHRVAEADAPARAAAIRRDRRDHVHDLDDGQIGLSDGRSQQDLHPHRRRRHHRARLRRAAQEIRPARRRLRHAGRGQCGDRAGAPSQRRRSCARRHAGAHPERPVRRRGRPVPRRQRGPAARA